jgi:hypothetical protein
MPMLPSPDVSLRPKGAKPVGGIHFAPVAEQQLVMRDIVPTLPLSQ